MVWWWYLRIFTETGGICIRMRLYRTPEKYRATVSDLYQQLNDGTEPNVST